jgi:hypothetical protein
VFATAALSGAIAHILFLIGDLDDPFSGRYTMARDPYERALAAFERDTHLVDAIDSIRAA